MLNLSVVLEDSARRYPNRDALVLGDTRLTYAQVNGAANQVANLLVERGIQPGDKVALSCPNLPSFPIVYYGVLKAGAVVVPLNVLLKGREVAYHLARRTRSQPATLRRAPGSRATRCSRRPRRASRSCGARHHRHRPGRAAAPTLQELSDSPARSSSRAIDAWVHGRSRLRTRGPS
jgi:non-ribosomal peptide synthetase component F